MSIYAHPPVNIRVGRLSERPAAPSARVQGWWAWDTRQLFVADTDMDWFEVTGEAASPVTAVSVGDGAEVYKETVGDELRFRSLAAGSGKIDITQEADEVEIDLGEVNTTDLEDFSATPATDGQVPVYDDVSSVYVPTTLPAAETITVDNLGSGAEVYKEKVGGEIRLRTLAAGSSLIDISQEDDEIEFDLGEINTTDLADFDDATPDDGDVPVWDEGLGLYVPGPVSGGGSAVVQTEDFVVGEVVYEETLVSDGNLDTGVIAGLEDYDYLEITISNARSSGIQNGVTMELSGSSSGRRTRNIRAAFTTVATTEAFILIPADTDDADQRGYAKITLKRVNGDLVQGTFSAGWSPLTTNASLEYNAGMIDFPLSATLDRIFFTAASTDVFAAGSRITVRGYKAHEIVTGVTGGTAFAQELNDLADVEIDDPQIGQVLAYDGDDWINADPAGGWEIIASDLDIGSAVASFDITSIPLDWDEFHLQTILRISTSTVAQVGPRLRVNGNSTAGNYASQRLGGEASSAVASRDTSNASLTHGWVAGDDADAGAYTVLNVWLYNVRDTSKITSCVWTNVLRSTNTWYYTGSGHFLLTDAITSIQVVPPSGDFMAGSGFILRGRVND